MTASKIIARLMEWQPVLFGQLPLGRERCVLATRVGIDALARFGIAAEPRPVIAGVWNDGYERFRLQREVDPDVAPPDDGWSVWAGLPPDADDPPLAPTKWHGHLVVFVPARQLMLDLDFQAFSRPQKGLEVWGAFAAPWPRGESITCRQTGAKQPIYAYYRRNDENQAFRSAKDWLPHESTTDVVNLVERAIRKGALPC